MIRDNLLWGRRASSFTLQWHLTNECRFHCRHCYDRSDRGHLAFAESKEVLDGLLDFCRRRAVKPQVSLTGGDPLLHPDFWEIYRAAAKEMDGISILGNPIGADEIERMLSIKPPVYYQISMEGLEDYNDHIRGPGHFGIAMKFLSDARAQGLQTHVMLTLTKDNAGQVVDLGKRLRGLTKRLTFNRLAQTGEGASLNLPGPQEFEDFLKSYMLASHENPLLGMKDNLINILRKRHGKPLLPGCTGHGCGAAFNFVALLPDGEVHACRKFPSKIGDIRKSSLEEIYSSLEAKSYREGPAACKGCELRRNCRGCMAVIHGQGCDPLVDLDPFCFMDKEAEVT